MRIARTGKWMARGVGMALALLLLGEAWGRVSARWVFPRIRRIDDALGWRLVPDVHRVLDNEEGQPCTFVTDALGHVATSGSSGHGRPRARVLLLGDSFTEGLAVGSALTFAARLEELLPRVDILNSGVAGYGTVQELIYLREEGLGLDPDEVLLMFFDNDLEDNVRPWFLGMGARPYATLADDGVVRLEPARHESYRAFCMPVPLWRWLYRHSALYQSVNQKVWQAQAADQLVRLDEATRAAPSEALKQRVFLGLVWQMAQELQRARVGFRVIFIPRREHLARPVAEPYADLAAACARRGIRTHSLIDALRAARDAGREPYFDVDIHWNAEGHRVVADELAGLLRGGLDGGRRATGRGGEGRNASVPQDQ